MTDLEKAGDQVLIDWLPAAAKAAIDRMLADGESKSGILALWTESVKLGAGADWPTRRGQMAILAAEAYLETK